MLITAFNGEPRLERPFAKNQPSIRRGAVVRQILQRRATERHGPADRDELGPKQARGGLTRHRSENPRAATNEKRILPRVQQKAPRFSGQK